MLHLNYAVNHCSLSMKFAYWHPLYFHTSARFFPYYSLLRDCYEELQAVFFMCLSQSYDKCFLGSSETADANRVFCGQLGAIYVFSEALNPAQIFAIHQLGPGYKVCIRFAKVRYIPTLHSHHWSPRDVIPLSVTFGYWLMCLPTWFHHRPEEITTFWDLNLCWFLADHYCPATMLQNWIFQQEKLGVKSCIYIFTYYQMFVWWTIFFFLSCVIAFTLNNSKVSQFCFLMKSSIDEVCLWIVYSLSFPFMFLTFCR